MLSRKLTSCSIKDVVEIESGYLRSPNIVYIEPQEALKYLKSMLPQFLSFAEIVGLQKTKQSIETTLFVLSTESTAPVARTRAGNAP